MLIRKQLKLKSSQRSGPKNRGLNQTEHGQIPMHRRYIPQQTGDGQIFKSAKEMNILQIIHVLFYNFSKYISNL